MTQTKKLISLCKYSFFRTHDDGLHRRDVLPHDVLRHDGDDHLLHDDEDQNGDPHDDDDGGHDEKEGNLDEENLHLH